MLINPIRSPLDTLLENLNKFDSLLITLESRLTGYNESVEENLKRNNIDISKLIFASTLIVRNLDEWPSDGGVVHHPIPCLFKITGEEYLKTSEMIIRRESGFAVAQGYEAFETFMKNVTAAFLEFNTPFVDSNKINKFNKYLKKKRQYPKDIEYWNGFVRRCYSKNSEILALIHKIAPAIGAIEQRNSRGIDLVEWFKLATEVRDAVTHSNYLIKNAKLNGWTTELRQLFLYLFPGTNATKGYELEISRQMAELNLTLFAEYADLIFRYLSNLGSYPCATNSSTN